jgi:hypothetical protein
MKFNRAAIFVVSNVEFVAPQFQLLRDWERLLKGLHDNIAPSYPFSAYDVTIDTRSSLADRVLRISLFRGNGIIDIYIDRLSVSFSNLIHDSDITIALDCMNLIEKSLLSYLGIELIREFNIRPTINYISSNNDMSVRDFLTNRFRPSEYFELILKEDDCRTNIFAKFEFQSMDNAWRVGIDLMASTLDEKTLILTCNSYYDPNSRYSDSMIRGQHLIDLLTEFLAQSRIEITTGARF